MLVRYTGAQRLALPTLGLDLAPGDLFEVDAETGEGLVSRPDFKAGDSAPAQTIAEVLDTVGSDIDAARAALAAEEASPRPRKTLVDRLTQILEEG